MKKFSCLMSLAAMLCVSLFFSCTSTIEPPPPLEELSSGSQQSYCIFIDTQQCLEVANSKTTCPSGSELGLSCPSINTTSSASTGGKSSSGSAYYCVYDETETCLNANSTTCPGDGILTTSCPSSNTTSSASAGGKSSSSNQQASTSSSSINNSTLSSNGNSVNPTPGSGPVSYYGKLKASGNKIVGSKTGSTAVQVRGVSLGWSNTDWESSYFFNAATVNAMVDSWKAEIIRVPMGYAQQGSSLCTEYYGSYLADKSGNMARVKAAIDAAIAKGVYVIIDWHTHCATTADAQEYFAEMANLYGSYDHVIFEIFNEPKGTSWGWSSIRSYATTVINTIRTYSPNNLILVGTPDFDKEVDSVLDNPLTDNNVAYVVHFYADTHPLNGGSYSPNFASKINIVRTAGYPIFVSEYGTVSADGNGSHNPSASDTWMSFLNSNNISYCAWHVNNKDEASAFFKPTFTPSASAAWTNTSNMTASGQYIYSNLVSWSSNAPWRVGGGYNVTSSSSGSGGPISSTRCKDNSGNDYFCEWGYRSGYPSDNPGCFAIDPTFDSGGRACTTLISECQSYGSLYVNSTREGESLRCNGTSVTGSSSSNYCLDYYYRDCTPMSLLSSYGISCSEWADGNWEISSSCPSGWDYY